MSGYKSAPTPGMKVYNAHNPQHLKAFKAYARTELLPRLEQAVYKAAMRCICDESHPLYQWNIHHPDIDLKERVRRYLYDNFSDVVQKFYYNPESGETVAGWTGWYEFPKFGCLAFFTPDTVQYPGHNVHPENDPFFHW